LNVVEVWDPSTQSWGTAPSMPTVRGYLAAARDGSGKIYAIGGYNGNVLNTVEQYSPPQTIYTFIKN